MGGVMFAIGEAREVNGKWYESFEEKALPFLEEYGCLHFATAVVLGVSEPRYDEEELAKWKAEDAKTFTFERHRRSASSKRESATARTA